MTPKETSERLGLKEFMAICSSSLHFEDIELRSNTFLHIDRNSHVRVLIMHKDGALDELKIAA
jgi:hypothetical protein